jgi:N12 class adenine-specific DNA methylase
MVDNNNAIIFQSSGQSLYSKNILRTGQKYNTNLMSESDIISTIVDEGTTKIESPRIKLRRNIDIIKKVFEFEKSYKDNPNLSRHLLDNERELFKLYNGFGGIKAVLNPNEKKETWVKQDQPLFELVQELKQVLHENTEDEVEYMQYWDSIRSSTQTAYYTPEPIIEAMLTPIANSNIEIESMLDPSAGTGRYIDAMNVIMPSLKKVEGYEKDFLTGKVLQWLYGKERMHIDGFEKSGTGDDNLYDVVTSNIPFGALQVFDPAMMQGDEARQKSMKYIHSYFFAKGLDKAREGGLVAFITSSGFSDAAVHRDMREYLMNNARLISAIRLPNNAFSETNVSTDIIILQKTSNKNVDNITDNERKFIELTSTKHGFPINSYVFNRDNLIFTKAEKGIGQYGKESMILSYESNQNIPPLNIVIEDRIKRDIELNFDKEFYNINKVQVVKEIPVPIIKKEPVKIKMVEQEQKPAIKVIHVVKPQMSGQLNLLDDFFGDDDKKAKEVLSSVVYTGKINHLENGAFVFEPANAEKGYVEKVGVLSIHRNGQNYINDTSLSADATRMVRDYINVRTAYYDLIDTEQRSGTEEKDLRNTFNNIYDDFVRLHGRLHKNKQILKDDPIAHRIFNIENITIIDRKKDDVKVEKSDIFFKPTTILTEKKEYSIEEALIQSLNKTNKVNIAYISALSHVPEMDIIKELTDKERIFFNPLLPEKYEQRATFLSGNVYEKIDDIKAEITQLEQNGGRKFISAGKWQDFLIDGDRERAEQSLTALQKAIPEKVPYELLDFNLGERWIPLDIYKDFISEKFNFSDTKYINLVYDNILDSYYIRPIKNENNSWRDYNTSRDYLNDSNLRFRFPQYTVYRNNGSKFKNAIEIMEYALADVTPEITYSEILPNNIKKTYKDYKAMNKISEIIDEFRSDFVKYLRKIPQEQKQMLEDLYNKKFNAYVRPQYDGSYREFKGLTFDNFDYKALYSTQKNAIEMLIQNAGGIIDHEVGGGKTMIMACAAQEMKNLGIIKKPIIIGLKANTSAIYDTYCKAYPNAKILYAGDDEDFVCKRTKAEKDAWNLLSFDKKKEENDKMMAAFCRKAMNNDYDCIIMTHDQFLKIPQSSEIYLKVLKEEKNNIVRNLEVLQEENKNTGRKTDEKSLLIRLNNLEAKMEKIKYAVERRQNLQMPDLEQIGIDHIFVDESQQFKNLAYVTNHSRVAGLGNKAGSQRAENLLVALRTIQKKRGKDFGGTFLSGTPISNSIAEMYLLFKYLRPQMLKKQDINSFDAWAAVFAKKTKDYEFSVTNEIIIKERFRHFIKVPELAQTYFETADFKRAINIGVDRPEKHELLVKLTPSPEQERFTDGLIKFAKNGNVEALDIKRQPLSDSEMKAKMLIATNYAKNMSLDMRMIDSTKYEDNPNNKLSICAEKIKEYYDRFDQWKGTQFVFCDTGVWGGKEINERELEDEDLSQTGKKKKKPKRQQQNDYDMSDKWDAYSEMKRKLIEKGIPPNQIAFIQQCKNDEQKENLFEKMNNGEVRVLIGSTQKLGTGVNAQQRAVAVHHLDAPWRPSDMEQRNGRAVRTGNWVAKEHNDNKVEVFIYATEKTLDTFRFNLLANKQQFINQIKNNAMGKRSIDEGACGDETEGMSYNEYVAVLSGDTSLLEKAKLERKIVALEGQRTTFLQEKVTNKKKVETLDGIINKMEKVQKEIKNDVTAFNEALRKEVEYAKSTGTFIELSEQEKPFTVPVLGNNNKERTLSLHYSKEETKDIAEKLAKIAEEQKTDGKIVTIGNLLNDERFKICVETKRIATEVLDMNKGEGQQSSSLFAKDENFFYLMAPSGRYYQYNNGRLGLQADTIIRNSHNCMCKSAVLMLEKQEKEIAKLVQQRDTYSNIINNEWTHEQQLENLKKDLKKLMNKMEAENIKKNENQSPTPIVEKLEVEEEEIQKISRGSRGSRFRI